LFASFAQIFEKVKYGLFLQNAEKIFKMQTIIYKNLEKVRKL